MTSDAPPDRPSAGGEEESGEHPPVDLSPRELEVLMAVRSGLTSKEIASNLGISESTVNKHVTAAMRALAARSRSHAVAVLDAVLQAHHDAPAGATTDATGVRRSFADALVRVLAPLVGADSVFLAMWDGAREHLRVVAAVGPEIAVGVPLDAHTGWAGLAFHRDRVVSVGNRARMRATLRLPAGRETGSVAAAPVRAEGSVLGVLAAASDFPGHFAPAHLELLSLAAQLAGGQLVATRAREA